MVFSIIEWGARLHQIARGSQADRGGASLIFAAAAAMAPVAIAAALCRGKGKCAFCALHISDHVMAIGLFGLVRISSSRLPNVRQASAFSSA